MVNWDKFFTLISSGRQKIKQATPGRHSKKFWGVMEAPSRGGPKPGDQGRLPEERHLS